MTEDPRPLGLPRPLLPVALFPLLEAEQQVLPLLGGLQRPHAPAAVHEPVVAEVLEDRARHGLLRVLRVLDARALSVQLQRDLRGLGAARGGTSLSGHVQWRWVLDDRLGGG